jgi:hypothetical protein
VAVAVKVVPVEQVLMHPLQLQELQERQVQVKILQAQVEPVEMQAQLQV